jgi:hypothetical protein
VLVNWFACLDLALHLAMLLLQPPITQHDADADVAQQVCQQPSIEDGGEHLH